MRVIVIVILGYLLRGLLVFVIIVRRVVFSGEVVVGAGFLECMYFSGFCVVVVGGIVTEVGEGWSDFYVLCCDRVFDSFSEL